jgi:ketosteroid isomerase-like protein
MSGFWNDKEPLIPTKEGSKPPASVNAVNRAAAKAKEPICTVGTVIFWLAIVATLTIVGITLHKIDNLEDHLRDEDHVWSNCRKLRDVLDDFQRGIRKNDAQIIERQFADNGVYCDVNTCAEGKTAVYALWNDYFLNGGETNQSTTVRTFACDASAGEGAVEWIWSAQNVNGTVARSASQIFFVDRKGEVTKWQSYYDTNQTIPIYVPPPHEPSHHHH